MSMYNLLKYNDNYSVTLESLCSQYRGAVNKDNDNYRVNNDNNKTTTSKSFEYKAKIIGSTSINNNTLDTEVSVQFSRFVFD